MGALPSTPPFRTSVPDSLPPGILPIQNQALGPNAQGPFCCPMKDQILLQRKRKWLLPTPEGTPAPPTVLATVLKNIQPLGFTFSEALLNGAGALSQSQLEKLYADMLPVLKQMVGAHVEHKPFYPNFPQQVMDMTEAELYVNALRHYLTGWRPNEPAEPRPVLDEFHDMRVIDIGTEDDYNALMQNLMMANGSLSEADKNYVEWYLYDNFERLAEIMPAEIPNKENLAVIGAVVLQFGEENFPLLFPYFKTPTDVLRLAVRAAGGDVSLAEKTKFNGIIRSSRRLYLGLLENLANPPMEEMWLRRETWLRVAERLHPGEYKTRFPKTFAVFQALRNDKKPLTFNAQVEAAMAKRQTSVALKLLHDRPGMLARRLDHLLRTAPQPEAILHTFRAQADEVSTPVLLQAMHHFSNRERVMAQRIVFPKSPIAKVAVISKKLPPLDLAITQTVVEICQQTLIERFAQMPSLGKVYIDALAMARHIVPFSQRSASKALRTLVRGSRVPLAGDYNTIRLFIWWRNGDYRTDIDLSAVGLNDNFGFVTQLAYYNLKDIGGHHSGDIVDAPYGASEFIDIDCQAFLKRGVRYLGMIINSYTQQPYCDLPECFAGFMLRQKPNSGEIYDPCTVQAKMDLTANTQICIPAIIDLQTREIIWADLALRRHPKLGNNADGNMKGIQLMAYAVAKMCKPSLYDLLSLHISARGILVNTPADADTVFSETEGVTPYDTDRFLSEFLS